MNEKKKMFMELVEKAKNGTLDDFRMCRTSEYDDIYANLSNNNGPLGLVISGVEKDGKISVYLSDNMSTQKVSNLGNPHGLLGTLSFNESELSDFLDKFYDMNNMEILNEFYKNKENTSNYLDCIDYEKCQKDLLYFGTILMYNAVDYINSIKPGNLLYSAPKCFGFKDNFLMAVDYNDVGKIFLGNESFYDFINSKIEFQGENEDNLQTSKYLSILLKSVEDFPVIFERIKTGKYNKEDFLPNKNASLLNKKEEELQSLKVEEKIISETEALIQQIKEYQEIEEFDRK